jgi:putative serine protease PepD
MSDYQPPSPEYPAAEYGGYPPPPVPVPPAEHGPATANRDAPGVRRAVLTVAVVAALIGGGVGAGTVALVEHNDNAGTAASALSFSTQVAPAAKIDGTVSAAAAKIGPSVVTIKVGSATEQDTGSGVIIRADGYVLTNNHVIASASSGGTIGVTLADGRQSAATVVGTDPSDDLAVIKLKLTGLTPAVFASSSALVVGQTVVAVGAPLGLSDTVTSGIVSNIARPVQTGETSNDQAVFNAVQTDAAINPGNSGGPLVDLNGHVVGINAAIATDQSSGGLQLPGQQSQSGNIGIGFAIPSDEASRIATELIATGRATHALLGISVADVQAPSSGPATAGALVRSVTAGSPAAGIPLQPGDVVTELDHQRIDTADALVAAVRSHAPKQSVSLTYQRNDRTHTATVTLGADAS